VNITLTPHGEELLRVARERHPDQSPVEILEQALADHIAREQTAAQSNRKRTTAEFRAWLDEFSALSGRIPALPGETFSREMIYQDHD